MKIAKALYSRGIIVIFEDEKKCSIFAGSWSGQGQPEISTPGRNKSL